MEDCFTVLNNDGFYVFGAAITNFDVISVENTVNLWFFVLI